MKAAFSCESLVREKYHKPHPLRSGQTTVRQEYRIDKVEYTQNSELLCLRLEDSFLPGALRNPENGTFRSNS